MKRCALKFFTLFLLLGFATQPLLVQARAISHATPPCPMQMQQQMGHHDMGKHGACVGHSGQLCSDCDLCSLSSSVALSHLPVLNNSTRGGTAVVDVHRGTFVSTSLPVDSPPPRSL